MDKIRVILRDLHISEDEYMQLCEGIKKVGDSAFEARVLYAGLDLSEMELLDNYFRSEDTLINKYKVIMSLFKTNKERGHFAEVDFFKALYGDELSRHAYMLYYYIADAAIYDYYCDTIEQAVNKSVFPKVLS
jgi:hypothetical protein